MWAVVPIKQLSRSKSRLAEVLDPEQRSALQASLLADLLTVLSQCAAVENVLVVSADPKVQELARSAGASTIPDAMASAEARCRRLRDPEAGLNAAVESAAEIARDAGAGSVLILPGDLPCVTTEDVAEIVAALPQGPRAVVVVPDRHAHGTNALLCRPPDAVPFAFGPRSAQAHREAAIAAGARVETLRNTNLGLDLDTLEDVGELLSRDAASPRVAALLEVVLPLGQPVSSTPADPPEDESARGDSL